MTSKIRRLTLLLALLFLSLAAFFLRSAEEKQTQLPVATGTDARAVHTDADVLPEIEQQVSDAERVLSKMSTDEKIGQLFMIRPDQLKLSLTPLQMHSDEKGVKKVDDDMKETLAAYPAGGFIIFSKNISSGDQLKKLNSALGDASPYATLIAVDEEGGAVTRVATAPGINVPYVTTMREIGGTKDPEKARAAGETIGGYLADYGFNMDFAPDADVDSNPANPVIGNRSFGKDPKLVAEMDAAFLDGLHANGVYGVIKHYPGHGDTKSDTHYGTVKVSKTWEKMEELELIPFLENLDKTDAVMVAHITLTKSEDGLPASISPDAIEHHLRELYGYDGVVVTDAMMMEAIRKHYGSGEAAVMAIEAGADIVLMPYDYVEAFEAVRTAVEEGRISEERLDASVLRILRLKYGN